MNTNKTTEEQGSPSFLPTPERPLPTFTGAAPLIFGSLLLYLAICLYLSGMWLPAGVCCVVGAGWMATLLEEIDRKDEE